MERGPGGQVGQQGAALLGVARLGQDVVTPGDHWLCEMNPRLFFDAAYPSAPNSRLNPIPPTRPTIIGTSPAPGFSRLSTSPRNTPNIAPDSAELVSTLLQPIRPAIRSTRTGSTPTMVTSVIGKSVPARWSTARCASEYDSYEPIGHPLGIVGS